jgi:DNA-binding XRE family transcriptional regulator
VPIADWERIIDALDDLEDIFFLQEYQADPNEELLPAEMVYALLEGENPIRVWREHRRLSQEQVAEAAEVSKSYLAQLEAGERQGSERLIKRLSKALRVDVDDLLGSKPEAEGARPTATKTAGRQP